MKTNEAPEKIYLQENTTTDCYDEWWPEWFEARAKDNDVEYIRTDAFIERACEWLKNNAGKYAFVDIDRIGNVADIDSSLIQDFRKYMERD